MRAFQGFKENPIKENVIWQESESIWPYQCSQCNRQFPEGGKRYLASSLTKQSHHAAAVLCPDCKEGRDPLRQKVPKLAERRKSLD